MIQARYMIETIRERERQYVLEDLARRLDGASIELRYGRTGVTRHRENGASRPRRNRSSRARIEVDPDRETAGAAS
jgi:hypothetical protein